eukprot:426548-Prymnesium_polylepis.1
MGSRGVTCLPPRDGVVITPELLVDTVAVDVIHEEVVELHVTRVAVEVEQYLDDRGGVGAGVSRAGADSAGARTTS